jgi:hypothetical protein
LRGQVRYETKLFDTLEYPRKVAEC